MYLRKFAHSPTLVVWLLVLFPYPKMLLCSPVQSTRTLLPEKRAPVLNPLTRRSMPGSGSTNDGGQTTSHARSDNPRIASHHVSFTTRNALAKRAFDPPSSGARSSPDEPSPSLARWLHRSLGWTAAMPRSNIELVQQESLPLRPQRSAPGPASRSQRPNHPRPSRSALLGTARGGATRHTLRAGAGSGSAQRARPRNARRARRPIIAKKMGEDPYLQELLAEEEVHGAAMREASAAMGRERRRAGTTSASSAAQKRYRQKKLMHDLVHHRLVEYGGFTSLPSRRALPRDACLCPTFLLIADHVPHI